MTGRTNFQFPPLERSLCENLRYWLTDHGVEFRACQTLGGKWRITTKTEKTLEDWAKVLPAWWADLPGDLRAIVPPRVRLEFNLNS